VCYDRDFVTHWSTEWSREGRTALEARSLVVWQSLWWM
jgi:hypothetical protein